MTTRLKELIFDKIRISSNSKIIGNQNDSKMIGFQNDWIPKCLEIK